MSGQLSEEMRKCAFCKKTTKKAKRFYRNSRYYCNMNCWTKSNEKAAADKAEA
jgi:hypothetical protein